MNTHAQTVVQFHPYGLGELQIKRALPDTSHVCELSKHPDAEYISSQAGNFKYYYFPDGSLLLDSTINTGKCIIALDNQQQLCYIFLELACTVSEIDNVLNRLFTKEKWGVVSDFGGYHHAMESYSWINHDKTVVFSRTKYADGRIELVITPRNVERTDEIGPYIFIHPERRNSE